AGRQLTDLAVMPAVATGTVWATTQAIVEDQPVTLQVGLTRDFPSALPLVRLAPWDVLGMLPHVSTGNGIVCYQDSEGLLLNKEMPAELVWWAVEQALAELTKGVRGENKADFTEEFEASWAQLTRKGTLRNVVDPPTHPNELGVIWRSGTEAYLTDSDQQVASFLQFKNIGTYTRQRATFLPLPVGSYIQPPRPDRPFWSAADLRQWAAPAIEALSEKEHRALLESSKSQNGVVVLALARPSQGVALLAVRYQSPTGQHPLLPGVEAKLWPLHVARWEPSYLVPRGGGQVSLREKHVLLVGCGAVGGHLAHDLVRSGVLRLTLVDADTHSVENTFRHVLGIAHKTAPKAEALRDELRAKYPYLMVEAVASNIEPACRTGKVKLAAFDLVVAATGNPTAELWLNEHLHSLPAAPPALFTWLEAYGIGGHALLTQPGQPGCLQCLYTDPEQPQLVNRAAFAASGQLFSMSLAGCSARHTPYGSLDATRTAEVAARLALQVLTDREKKAPLISWKGDAEDFVAAGFVLADRFGVSEEKLNRNRYGYVAPTCPICGSTAAS
ncbi:MAG TPA: ThiF family adenylyltransferase, partial [Hymenobacter sp.]